MCSLGLKDKYNLLITSFNNRLLFILALATLIRLPFVFLTPRWQAPDEYPHFHYIRILVETGRLPFSRPQFPDYEAYQPPLYYLVGAGLFQLVAPWGVPEVPEEVSRIEPDVPLVVVVLRLFSVLLGVATVYLAYRIGRQVFAHNQFLAFALPVMLALHPTFISNTTAITNDALANFIGALFVWILVHPNDHANFVLVGASLGVAFLTKHNLLPFTLLALLVLWRGRKSFISWLRQSLLILAIALLLSGWFYLYNLQRYGNLLAINPGVETQFTALLWDWSRWIQVIRNYNWSFWCAFGRIYEIHLPPWFYLVFFVPLTLFILYGAGRAVWSRFALMNSSRKDHGPADGFPGGEVTRLFVFGLLLYAGAALGYTASYPLNCAWGKYVFPFLIPIWALILSTLHAAVGPRFLKILVVFLAASFIFINIMMLWQLAHLQ